jgi:hypothetical protein
MQQLMFNTKAIEAIIMAKQDNKTFTVAGYATNSDGTVKVRFANDLVSRIKILNKAGCTNVNLVELPRPMTKLEALEFMNSQGITGDAGFVVSNKLAEKQRVAERREVNVVLRTGSRRSVKTTEPTEA